MANAQEERLDFLFLKASGFDHCRHHGKPVGPRFCAISEGEFAKDDDGAELTLGTFLRTISIAQLMDYYDVMEIHFLLLHTT